MKSYVVRWISNLILNIKTYFFRVRYVVRSYRNWMVRKFNVIYTALYRAVDATLLVLFKRLVRLYRKGKSLYHRMRVLCYEESEFINNFCLFFVINVCLLALTDVLLHEVGHSFTVTVHPLFCLFCFFLFGIGFFAWWRRICKRPARKFSQFFWTEAYFVVLLLLLWLFLFFINFWPLFLHNDGVVVNLPGLSIVRKIWPEQFLIDAGKDWLALHDAQDFLIDLKDLVGKSERNLPRFLELLAERHAQILAYRQSWLGRVWEWLDWYGPKNVKQTVWNCALLAIRSLRLALAMRIRNSKYY
jgi:hypothetical protein